MLGPRTCCSSRTYRLSGQLGTELTNASTTGLLDTRVMNWVDELFCQLAADACQLPVVAGRSRRPAGATR